MGVHTNDRCRYNSRAAWRTSRVGARIRATPATWVARQGRSRPIDSRAMASGKCKGQTRRSGNHRCIKKFLHRGPANASLWASAPSPNPKDTAQSTSSPINEGGATPTFKDRQCGRGPQMACTGRTSTENCASCTRFPRIRLAGWEEGAAHAFSSSAPGSVLQVRQPPQPHEPD